MAVSAGLRRRVIERAESHCEYCGLAQTGQEAAFHIDHLVPVVAGGRTALAQARVLHAANTLHHSESELAAKYDQVWTISGESRLPKLAIGAVC